MDGKGDVRGCWSCGSVRASLPHIPNRGKSLMLAGRMLPWGPASGLYCQGGLLCVHSAGKMVPFLSFCRLAGLRCTEWRFFEKSRR